MFPHIEYNPESLNFSVKHPAKFKMWGCTAASGVGRLDIVERMVNTEKYIGILEKHMLLSVEQLFTGNYFFQDDNAPYHRTKVGRREMEFRTLTDQLNHQDLSLLRI